MRKCKVKGFATACEEGARSHRTVDAEGVKTGVMALTVPDSTGGMPDTTFDDAVTHDSLRLCCRARFLKVLEYDRGVGCDLRKRERCRQPRASKWWCS